MTPSARRTSLGLGLAEHTAVPADVWEVIRLARPDRRSVCGSYGSGARTRSQLGAPIGGGKTHPDRSMVSTLFWHNRRVERADYEEIAGQLHGLLIRLDDRLPGKDLALIAEFVDAGELGLALEQMADVLSEDEQPLASDERCDILGLVARMEMDGRVQGALSFCPER
jgi:hypothetical protein